MEAHIIISMIAGAGVATWQFFATGRWSREAYTLHTRKPRVRIALD